MPVDNTSSYYVLQLSPEQIIAMSSHEHSSSYLLRLSLSCQGNKYFRLGGECKRNGLADEFRTLTEEESSPSCHSDIKTKLAAARILLTILEDIAPNTRNNDKIDKAISGCIYNAIVYINKCYSENITAAICAKKVFMSYGHFSRSFKRVTGANFKDYLNTIRVNRTRKALIGTNESGAEMCRKCGFNTVSYFISIFRRITGTTPATYREINRSKASSEEISEENI